MNRFILSAIASAAAGLASISSAAIPLNLNCTLTDLGQVRAGTTASPTTLTGYEAFMVTLSCPTGVINGFDFTSNVPGGGIFGPLVQRISASGADVGYDSAVVFSAAKNSSNSVTNVDSHFLFTSAADPNLVGAIGAGESYGGSAAPVDGATSAPGLPANTDNNGFYLSGATGSMSDASGLAVGIQTNSLPAIYLVAPISSFGQLYGLGSLSTTAGVIPVGFSFPEPGSICMLGIGGVSLLSRRRASV